MEFEPDLGENPDPRIACALVLDTSGSMDGEPIAQLNRGFEAFRTEIRDPNGLASKRAEICVITVATEAEVAIPFTEARYLEPREFTAGGRTSMGAGLDLALDELEQRKQRYRDAGLDYYRPWLFVLTDGLPTDADAFERATGRLASVERAKGASVFAIGVGDGVNQETLRKLSPTREPQRLDAMRFVEFFEWLSASVSTVTASAAYGGSDADADAAGAAEQVALPPVGWGSP